MPTSLVCFDRGSGFSAGSLVIWSVTALATIYVSSNQLKARVPSASIASHTRAWIASIERRLNLEQWPILQS
jgi:hypothetical protein